jgi:hypothetical protein
VESAIALAARELGDEAMLVYSRPSSPESQYLGKYEVVFALEEGHEAAAAVSLRSPATGGGDESIQAKLSLLLNEVGKLSGRMAGTVPENAASAPATRRSGEPGGVSRSLWRTAGNSGRLQGDELPADVNVLDLLELAKRGSPIVIAGPAGAGKSTSVMKLAAKIKALSGAECRIATLDTARVGGAAWLRNAAGLLGLEFSLIRSEQDLLGHFELSRRGGALLMDSPPFESWEPALLNGFKREAARSGGTGVLLACPATWNPGDLRRTLERYRELKPAGLVLTMVDQTVELPAFLSALCAARTPVSAVSSGPNIAGNFHTGPELCELLKLWGLGCRVADITDHPGDCKQVGAAA